MAINVKDKLVTVESLGIAYSAEQDAREEADQALSTRIDNIVAPEGDPSLTEVSDARVSGSTTHNTLKARLDADKAAIETEISGINERLDEFGINSIRLLDLLKDISGNVAVTSGTGNITISDNVMSGAFGQWASIQLRNYTFTANHKYGIHAIITNNSENDWVLSLAGLNSKTAAVAFVINKGFAVGAGGTAAVEYIAEDVAVNWWFRLSGANALSYGDISVEIYAYDLTELTEDEIQSIDLSSLYGDATITYSGGKLKQIEDNISENTQEINNIESIIGELGGKNRWSNAELYQVMAGKPLRIYFNEIFDSSIDGYFSISVDGGISSDVSYNDRWIEIKSTVAKSFTVNISYIDFCGDNISSASINVNVESQLSTIPAKKYMFIGDSLTDISVSGSELLKYFSDTLNEITTGSVTLYGTRGVAPYLNEGRSGWSTYDYWAQASKNGLVNPFYNPTQGRFDFSYYMTQHPEYADVDIVNIFLGRNDGYIQDAVARIGFIVNSIHSFNPNIICTIMSAYNLEPDNSSLGESLQNVYTYNITGHRFNISLINKFLDDSKSVVVPQHYNLDSKYDYNTETVAVSPQNTETYVKYTDGVHPKASGYQHFALVYLAYINHLLMQ